MFADDLPLKKPVAHEVGMDLSLLSVADLEARIHILSNEIKRLEKEIVKKTQSRATADAFFKSS